MGFRGESTRDPKEPAFHQVAEKLRLDSCTAEIIASDEFNSVDSSACPIFAPTTRILERKNGEIIFLTY